MRSKGQIRIGTGTDIYMGMLYLVQEGYVAPREHTDFVTLNLKPDWFNHVAVWLIALVSLEAGCCLCKRV